MLSRAQNIFHHMLNISYTRACVGPSIYNCLKHLDFGFIIENRKHWPNYSLKSLLVSL